MSTKITFEHEAQVKEETYKVGDWFINPKENCLAVISRVGDGRIALIGHETNGQWNRFYAPHRGSGSTILTKEDIAGVFENKLYQWQRVSVEITTKPYQP